MAFPTSRSMRIVIFAVICFVLAASLLGPLRTRTRLLPLNQSSQPSAGTPSKDNTLAHEEKHLVVASQKADDTSWIQRRLPDWTASIYVVDDDKAQLTVPQNKGREAMVYLTYLIDNYSNLPNTTVFIHSLQYQWHNDDPNYDTATTLSHLRLPYIASQGYVNLRCVWVLGCPDEIHVNQPRPDRPTEIAYRQAFEELFPAETVKGEIPDVVGVSCCAQFAVSREAVRQRKREEYICMRNWLINTPLDDDVSGRIMEYSWHILFHKPAVFCPDAQTCYCNVYGFCDLKGCTENQCPGRYTLPEYSSMPEGWKQLPEFDSGK